RVKVANQIVAAPDNFGVVRVLREFSNRSRIGVISVSRVDTDSSADHNVSIGIDGRLGLSDALTFDGFAAHSETPGRSGPSDTWSLGGNYVSPLWEFGAVIRQVDA